MIISASYRTDIPAFYSDWFRRRLAAGTVQVLNPYGGRTATVDLSPAAVSGFVFWTRNVELFFDVLDDLHAAGRPFVVHHTITGYPSALDAATIPAERAVAQVQRIARRYGLRTGVWRYDPVLFTDLTPPASHAETFSRLCGALAGSVDEVVLSVAQIYRKTARNLTAAAARFGFSWQDPGVDDKVAVLTRLAAIARDHGIAATICGQPDLTVAGLGTARCIDAERLADVAGRPIPTRRQPHRPRCGCWASRDIGAYDSCPHGCTYCYAVRHRDAAKAALARHDPTAPLLIPPRRRDAEPSPA